MSSATGDPEDGANLESQSLSAPATSPVSRPPAQEGGTPVRVAPAGRKAAAQADDDLPEQMRVRRDKRARLLNAGIDPYPLRFDRTATAGETGRLVWLN